MPAVGYGMSHETFPFPEDTFFLRGSLVFRIATNDLLKWLAIL